MVEAAVAASAEVSRGPAAAVSRDQAAEAARVPAADTAAAIMVVAAPQGEHLRFRDRPSPLTSADVQAAEAQRLAHGSQTLDQCMAICRLPARYQVPV